MSKPIKMSPRVQEVPSPSMEAEGVVQAPVEVVPERLSSDEMAKLDAAVAKRTLAQAQAENAELACKNVILQIFLAHGMSPDDQISSDGTIVRVSK